MTKCKEFNFNINIPSLLAKELEIGCFTPEPKCPPNISIDQGSTHLLAVPSHPVAQSPLHPPTALSLVAAAVS